MALRAKWQFMERSVTHKIVYMSLPDKAMLCIPNIYREMLKSFNNIREHVIFQHSIENIYLFGKKPALTS
jgi:hypothetical protein